MFCVKTVEKTGNVKSIIAVVLACVCVSVCVLKTKTKKTMNELKKVFDNHVYFSYLLHFCLPILILAAIFSF